MSGIALTFKEIGLSDFVFASHRARGEAGGSRLNSKWIHNPQLLLPELIFRAEEFCRGLAKQRLLESV